MALERLRSIGLTTRRAGQLAKIAVAAGQLARERARDSDGDRRRRAERALAGLLADAHGVPMKIGQILAQGSESHAFDALVSSIEPIPLAELQPHIEAELGHRLSEIFSKFDESRAAASLGQVHHAVLRDGREVAVKVRYPGIPDAVRAELRLAGLIPGVGPLRKWGFAIDAYRKVLSSNMERELDYRSEAKRQ